MRNESIINLTLKKELKEKIERIAKKRGLSISALIRLVFSEMEEK